VRPALWLVALGRDKLCCTNTHNDRGELSGLDSARFEGENRHAAATAVSEQRKSDSIQDRSGNLTVL